MNNQSIKQSTTSSCPGARSVILSRRFRVLSSSTSKDIFSWSPICEVLFWSLRGWEEAFCLIWSTDDERIWIGESPGVPEETDSFSSKGFCMLAFKLLLLDFTRFHINIKLLFYGSARSKEIFTKSYWVQQFVPTPLELVSTALLSKTHHCLPVEMNLLHHWLSVEICPQPFSRKYSIRSCENT